MQQEIKDEEKNDFYRELSKATKLNEGSTVKIIGGDFNARTQARVEG